MSGDKRGARSTCCARARHLWIDEITEDTRLTSTEKLIGIRIAERYLNSQSCRAWPANITVAKAVHKCTKTVQRAVNKLARFDYWVIERRHNQSNCYFFTSIKKAVDERGPAEAASRHERPAARTRTSQVGGRRCPPNLTKEHNKEPKAAETQPFRSKQYFSQNSPQARAWNEKLAECKLGSLGDYDVIEASHGDPDYAMPYMYPPTEPDEWRRIEEYLGPRRLKDDQSRDGDSSQS